MIVKPVSAPSPEPAASGENTFQLISLYRAWGDTWPGTDCRTWWPAGNTRRLHEIQGTGAEPCSPEQRWSVPRQEAGQQPGRVDGSTAHLRAAQIHQKYIGLWRRWCHHQHSDAVPKHSPCTDTEREEEEAPGIRRFPNPSSRSSPGDVCFFPFPFLISVLGLSFPLLSERAPLREGIFVTEGVTRGKAVFAHTRLYWVP